MKEQVDKLIGNIQVEMDDKDNSGFDLDVGEEGTVIIGSSFKQEGKKGFNK